MLMKRRMLISHQYLVDKVKKVKIVGWLVIYVGRKVLVRAECFWFMDTVWQIYLSCLSVWSNQFACTTWLALANKMANKNLLVKRMSLFVSLVLISLIFSCNSSFIPDNSCNKLGWAEPHSRFPLSFPIISP